MSTHRQKLTKQQREALKEYNFALQQEDRYLGSVFVNAHGQRKVEARTQEAYARVQGAGNDARAWTIKLL